MGRASSHQPPPAVSRSALTTEICDLLRHNASLIENRLGDVDRRLGPHCECHGIRRADVDSSLLPRLLQHQPHVESAVGQVGELDAAQMATEAGK